MLRGGVVTKMLPILSSDCPASFRMPAVQTVTNLTADHNFHELTKLESISLVIPPIILLLQTSEVVELREQAARLIKNVAMDEHLREVIVKFDGVAALVHACRPGGREQLQAQAARALGNIAMNDDNETRIIQAGGVEALTLLLSSTDEELLDALLGALGNIITNPIVRVAMVDAGGVRLLHPIMMSETELLYKQAGWIVACLAADQGVAARFVEEDGLKLLAHYASKPNEACQEEAAWALANLSSSPSYAQLMVETEMLPVLLDLASSSSSNVRLQAVWALANLAVNQGVKEQLGNLGGVRILLEALATGMQTAEVEDMLVQTTRAITNLAVTARNRELILAHETGLSNLIEATQSAYPSLQEASARALVNLSYDAELARAIVLRGGIPAISPLLSSPKASVQREAMWVIVNLSVLPEHEAVLTTPEVLEPLIAALHTSDLSVQEQAAWALANVSSNATSKVAIINLGALEALKALNEQRPSLSSPDVQAAASKALKSLIQVLTPQSRRIFVQAGSSLDNQITQSGKARQKTKSPLSKTIS